MSDFHQSILWHMGSLGQAAPVRDDLGSSSCQDTMPTPVAFSLSEAVRRHKLRIIHTLSNRAR